MSLQDISYADYRPQPGIAYIYALCDPRTDEIRYIGKTSNPKRRLSSHVCRPEIYARSHKAHWIKSLLDSGLSPYMIVLESVPESEWMAAECQWIDYVRSHGYELTNLAPGGSGGGFKHSEETKQRMREMPHPWLFTEEARRKASASKTGQKRSPESLERMRIAHLGHVTSEETKRKLSAAHIGRPKSDEHRENIRKAKIGTTQSAESRRKQSDAKRGVPQKRQWVKYSEHVGVTFDKGSGKWFARVTRNGKRIHLGSYLTEELAAKTIDALIEQEHVDDAAA